MSDPLTYTTWDAAIITCGTCDRDNNTTIWGDTGTGEWGYEFDCTHCGEPNHDHEYGPSERGSVSAYALLIIVPILFGLALAFIGLLGHSWSLISFGVGTAAIVTLAARVAAVERNRS